MLFALVWDLVVYVWVGGVVFPAPCDLWIGRWMLLWVWLSDVLILVWYNIDFCVGV